MSQYKIFKIDTLCMGYSEKNRAIGTVFLSMTWRRICPPDIRSVSALEVLRNLALQIDIYLLTYILTYLFTYLLTYLITYLLICLPPPTIDGNKHA